MPNEKKVSEFTGRAAAAKPGPKENQPAPSNKPPGEFDRNPCGECWHWKPDQRLGLNRGKCMFGPPTSFPLPGANGQSVGNMLTRPVLAASSEGCDQWDDECEFVEGEGGPAEVPQLAAAGGE